MPNVPTHLSLATKAASRMAHPVINEYLGSFLLGSTSPDIRIITKWNRDRTHFAPLDIDRIGTGVQALLQTHPDLADSSRVSGPTKAFLSGYFTHLNADEAWILKIYRPYFDGHHLFADQVEANIWDRALQLHLDMEARDELEDMEQVRFELDGAESGVDVGFISAETLSQWREWIIEFMGWEYTWDRLRFAARRMYGDNAEAQAMAEEFLECVPSSLERMYTKIPEERVAAYRQIVVQESVRCILEYLSVP